MAAACSEAKFDQCTVCTGADSNDKHECKNCSAGYTLKDDKSECLCTYPGFSHVFQAEYSNHGRVF